VEYGRGQISVNHNLYYLIMNEDKIILDLCGGTGAWSKPWEDAGYTVLNVTLPDYDILLTQTFPDRVTFRSPKRLEGTVVLYRDIYGILAAPPCTEFSRAKSTKPRDFDKGMETIEKCMEIIWAVQKNTKLKFWALENPLGLLRRFLGDPPYSFEQWWFGNDRTKATDLWGKFNEPKRLVYTKPIFLATTKGYKNKKGENIKCRNAKWYSSAVASERAITPAGFAKAFYKANK